MTVSRRRHVITLAAWAAFQGLFLALHFSWFNLGVLLLGALFLFCATVCGKRHDNTMVLFTLGHLVGVTFAVFAGYYIASVILPYLLSAESFGAALSEMLQMGMECLGDGMDDGPPIGNILIAILVLILKKKLGEKHPFFEILCKYAFVALLIFIPLSAWCSSWTVKGLYLAAMAIFICCDVMIYRCNDAYPKTGRRWFVTCSILLLVVLLLNPYALEPFTEEGFVEYFFLIKGLKWYVALIEFLILLLATIGMKVGANVRNPRQITDFFLYLNVLCVFAMIFVLAKFYVGYWWVFALLYGICVLFSLIVLPPKRTADRRMEPLSLYWLPVITGILMIIVISAHYGWLRVALVFWAGVVVLIPSIRDYADSPYHFAGKTQTIFFTKELVWIALVAGMILWSFRRLLFSYLLLLGIFAVCLAFVWFIGYDSGLFKRDWRVVGGSAVVVFLVLCLCLCLRGGSRIEMNWNEDGLPAVEVEARGDENELGSVEYYWLDLGGASEEEEDSKSNKNNKNNEENEEEEATKDSLFPQEVELDPEEELPAEDGRLRVVATDANGIVTERVFWIHINAYEAALAEVEE